MGESQIYKCSLTLRLIKKSHDGRRTLDVQFIHIPIMGYEGSKYHINYHVCLPKYYHLSRKSISMVSGHIAVRHGHAYLSNNNKTFIYEINTGVLVVRYLNQNDQEVGHGLVSKDMGTNLRDVTSQVPVPPGYYCDDVKGVQFENLAQSLVIHVGGKLANLQQSALRMTRCKIDSNGHLIHKQAQIIHVPGRIGDSFNLQPDDYRFPRTVSRRATSDVDGTITPHGPYPSQVKFTYVVPHAKLLSYPLTVRILKDNWGLIHSETTVKQVRGYLHQPYHYSYRDFKPRGFQLNPDSQESIDGYITQQGLSRPTVAFIYDKIKLMNIKYINQSDRLVGSFRANLIHSTWKHVQHYLQVPTGYEIKDKLPHLDRNTDTVRIRVQGKPATSKQNTVRLQIARCRPNGQLIARRIQRTHVSGCIGDYFKLNPLIWCPSGYTSRQNRLIRGVITPQGTKVNYCQLRYLQKPASSPHSSPRQKIGQIRVHYVNNDNRIIREKTFFGPIGSHFDQRLLLKSVPEPYLPVRIVSGQQIQHFNPHKRTIVMRLRKKNAPRSVANYSRELNHYSSLASSLQSAPSVPNKSHHASSLSASSGVAHKSHLSSSASSTSISNQQSSQPTRQSSSSVHSSQSSSQKSKAQPASSASSQSQPSSSASSKPKDWVKKAFLDRCYSSIFKVDLTAEDYKLSTDQAKTGIKLADGYIRGIKDALSGKAERQSNHSYHYGYQSCKKIAKHAKHPDVSTVLLAIIKHLPLSYDDNK